MRAPALAGGRALCHVDLVPAIPDRQLVAPPGAATRLRADALEPVQVDVGPGRLRVKAPRPSRTASMAGPVSVLMSQNHCSEISGSMRRPEAVQWGTSIGTAGCRTLLAQGGDHRRSCSLGLHAAKASGAASVIRAVLADHRDLVEPVRAADLEVAQVVAGGHLERARAERWVDVLVRDDRQPAPDERGELAVSPTRRGSARARVHRDRGVGEHRLGPYGRHGQRPRRTRGVIDQVEGVLDLALVDLRSEIAVRSPGSQLTRYWSRVTKPLLEQVNEHPVTARA